MRWLLAAALVAGGCRNQTVVNGTNAEQQLEDHARTLGLDARVRCPDDASPTVGSRLVCKVEVAGDTLELEVTVSAVKGTTLSLEGRWLGRLPVNGPFLAKFLHDQIDDQVPDVGFDCGSTTTLVEVRDRVNCTLSLDGTPIAVRVRFMETGQPVDWTYTPAVVLRAQLVGFLGKEIGAGVAITCPGDAPYVIARDDVVDCATDDGTNHHALRVHFEPGTPDVERWELLD